MKTVKSSSGSWVFFVPVNDYDTWSLRYLANDVYKSWYNFILKLNEFIKQK